MGDIQIASRYLPGALGRMTELHGMYYHQNWGLDLYFEARVATEMAAFLSRFDTQGDGAWFAYDGNRVIGGVVIDGHDPADEGARLRWFILDPAYQGQGIGNRLLQAAMDFCDQKGFPRVYLTTFVGLDTARHLYEKHGFRFCAEVDATELTGDPSKVEQVFERIKP